MKKIKKMTDLLILAFLLCATILLTACTPKNKVDFDSSETTFEPSASEEHSNVDLVSTEPTVNLPEEDPNTSNDTVSSIGLTYQVNADGTTCIITGRGTCTDTDIVIPKEIDGYTVTGICKVAFTYGDPLTSITIPDSVTSIERYAFEDCSSLKKVYISDLSSWCNINFDGAIANPLHCGAELYANNKLITTLVIPDDVTELKAFTFTGCTGIQNVIIPNHVTSLGNSTFYKCGNLTEVSIPDTITEIGRGIFSDCITLANITIPNSVTKLGERAFSRTGLTQITIPQNVTSIAEDAFSGCTNLSIITVDKNNPAYHSVQNCLIETETKTLVAGCKDSIIPTDGSVTRIGDCAFKKCDSLTRLTIPNGVTSIGAMAFEGCTNLVSITIPDGVTSIGDSAFYYCYDLTGVILPQSVTELGEDVFRACTSLTEIILPDRITSIKSFSFYECESLMSIIIPNGVTSIGSCAFYGCKSLTSVIIPDSVTEIEYNCFGESLNIKSIVLGSGIKRINGSVLDFHKQLGNIYYKGTETEWNTIDFGNSPDFYLTCAPRYYYSEAQPTTSGNYWRYVDGVPTAW